MSSNSTPYSLRRVCPPLAHRRTAAAGFQVSTKPRVGQIKAAGSENHDGTEATLGQELIIFPFGPFPSTWTAQHVQIAHRARPARVVGTGRFRHRTFN